LQSFTPLGVSELKTPSSYSIYIIQVYIGTKFWIHFSVTQLPMDTTGGDVQLVDTGDTIININVNGYS